MPVCLQLALEPLWKAYEACEPGADAKAILGKMAKGLNLQQVPIRRMPCLRWGDDVCLLLGCCCTPVQPPGCNRCTATAQQRRLTGASWVAVRSYDMSRVIGTPDTTRVTILPAACLG